jgi:hypothetical protein
MGDRQETWLSFSTTKYKVWYFEECLGQSARMISGCEETGEVKSVRRREGVGDIRKL